VELKKTKMKVKYYNLKNIIIYGAGHTGKRLARVIKQYPKLGYHALGFIDDFKFKRSERVLIGNPLPILGGKDELKEIIKNEELDELFVAMPNASLGKMVDIKELCEQYQVPYKFIPSLNKLTNPQVRVEQLAGIPLFTEKEFAIPFFRQIIKRIFDIFFSIIILFLVVPLVLIVALLIKRDSPGSFIFKQKRIGQHGKEFIMYKFRTMYKNTPQYALHPTSSDDPRITKIGRFLRRTCLDELPQFWNVLKGAMSVVGPRPEMDFIVKNYNQLHRERLNIKPGITGLWQISGDRSLPIHENIDHDLYYIEHQSLLLDMIIIFETIIFTVRGIGHNK